MNSENSAELKSAFISKTSTLIINTSSAPEFIDITERIISIVEKSEVTNGIATIFSRHTTSAIIIQENEPLLLNDMSSLLENLSPDGECTVTNYGYTNRFLNVADENLSLEPYYYTS